MKNDVIELGGQKGDSNLGFGSIEEILDGEPIDTVAFKEHDEQVLVSNTTGKKVNISFPEKNRNIGFKAANLYCMFGRVAPCGCIYIKGMGDNGWVDPDNNWGPCTHSS